MELNIEKITEKKEQLEEWLNSTIELSEEVEEALPDIDEIEERYSDAISLSVDERNKNREISDCVNGILDAIDLPEVVPPDIRIDPPWKNCLFDSRRSNEEQKKILQHYKTTGKKLNGPAR